MKRIYRYRPGHCHSTRTTKHRQTRVWGQKQANTGAHEPLPIRDSHALDQVGRPPTISLVGLSMVSAVSEPHSYSPPLGEGNRNPPSGARAHAARRGLEETQTERHPVRPPAEYVHGHTLPIMLTQIRSEFMDIGKPLTK